MASDTDATPSSSSSSTTSSYNHFTHAQEVTIFATGIASFTLSFLGSATILFLVARTGKWKTQPPRRRLVRHGPPQRAPSWPPRATGLLLAREETLGDM